MRYIYKICNSLYIYIKLFYKKKTENNFYNKRFNNY